jgi:predicted alpha/beta-fold hydrolase
MAPGLGGGARNLYTIRLLREAQRQGYKVGTILFRCADGLPVTSGKVSYSGAWEDCKFVIEKVHKLYV